VITVKQITSSLEIARVGSDEQQKNLRPFPRNFWVYRPDKMMLETMYLNEGRGTPQKSKEFIVSDPDLNSDEGVRIQISS